MVKDYPLFYHWHPCKFVGLDQMGWWFELVDGSKALVPSVPGRPVSECVGSKPNDNNPCPRCGWEGKVEKCG